jgi:hypothetical protein
VGTKYDAFALFGTEEQEEITKQVRRGNPYCLVISIVCVLTPSSPPPGTTICKGNEGAIDLLFHQSFHQCAKDLQGELAWLR